MWERVDDEEPAKPANIVQLLQSPPLKQHFVILAILPVLNVSAQWLFYMQSALTFKNSVFCPHSVFMRFVWTIEQTAVISLYNIY